jgi:benzoyl-CoA 2,3-dioxygenase component B
VIDLPLLQRKANFHYSPTLDLFGSELSTNAATVFHAGLKGRFQETKIKDEHQLTDATYDVLDLVDGRFEMADRPALNALNARLRDDFITNCQRGVDRFDEVTAAAGIDSDIRLPHVAFNRKIGRLADQYVTPNGEILGADEWERRRDEFIPASDDAAYIDDLMRAVVDPGDFAGWIAPPRSGIDNKPGDFEYMRLAA